MSKRRRRLRAKAKTNWTSFAIGVVSSIVGGFVVYALVKDARVT